MKIYRVRNTKTGEFWKDAYQANRRVKRIYYAVGTARGALKSFARMHNKYFDIDEYEIVEYELTETNTFPHTKKSKNENANKKKLGVDN